MGYSVRFYREEDVYFYLWILSDAASSDSRGHDDDSKGFQMHFELKAPDGFEEIC